VELAVKSGYVTKLREAIVKSMKNEIRIIIVSGPPGCGKSSTLELICREMDIETISWENKKTRQSIFLNDKEENSSKEGVMKPFIDFILGEKYPSINIRDNNKKLIVIEDIPYQHGQKQVQEFKDCLIETIYSSIANPIIFILTDESNGYSKVDLIFHSEITKNDKVSLIRFNKITLSNMKKVINRIKKKNKK